MSGDSIPIRPESTDLFYEIRSAFTGHLASHRYSKGGAIYLEGDDAKHICGIEEGIVKIARIGFHGKEWIARLAGPQELLALNDVLGGQPYGASAIALAPVRLWKIEAARFRKKAFGETSLTEPLMNWIVRRVRSLELSVELFSNGKAEERIANLLARLSIPCADEHPDCRCLPFRLTRQDMAEMVGITPETCGRVLSRFKRTGMIKEGSDRRLHVATSLLKSYFRSIESDRRPKTEGD